MPINIEIRTTEERETAGRLIERLMGAIEDSLEESKLKSCSQRAKLGTPNASGRSYASPIRSVLWRKARPSRPAQPFR